MSVELVCGSTTEKMTTTDYYDDYNNTSYSDEDLSKYAPCDVGETWKFIRSFAPVAYSLVFVLAVVGNVLVLCVVRRYRQAQRGPCSFSLTDTFLLHLAVSDLLLAFSLPFFAVQSADSWIFGTVPCKMVGAMFSLNIYCGVLFLACISFDRYLAIVHAVSAGWRRNGCHAQVACAVIWAACVGLAAVDVQYRQVLRVAGVQVCKMQFADASSKQIQVGLQLMNLALAFALPLLVMLYCYVRIFRALCHASRRQKRKSLRLIVSLVVVFVVSWAPYNGLRLVDSLIMLDVVAKDCDVMHAIDMGTVVAESMGLAHCALNPLLYGFVGIKFRRELAQMFKAAMGPRGGCQELGSWWRGSRRRTAGSFSSVESENTSYFSVVV
ncbi:C-X-C chemokine receptor type 3-2 isoform X1 [Alosa pseudoharengus]|uniref:C-X-C chemokine receptor type 3-2 isoform X1 n=2 Tax=Alosa pseudoharengus TaxID=34774 RepID=UPI003F89DEF9